MRNKYTDTEIEFLIDNYSNRGIKYCSEKLNRTSHSIQMKCQKLKLKVNRNWQKENRLLWSKNRLPEDYKVNFIQFIKISTPICAYILGLLWADGHICPPYEISLATTYPDAKYFISLFLKTGKWKYYSWQPKNKKWKKACQIKTTNLPFVNFLLENDYKSKSYESADKILSIIPQELKHYWFRGLLDGDGTIRTTDNGSHSISFSSSVNQNWNYLESLCKELNLEYHIIKEHRNGHAGSSFNVYGMYKTIKFCEYIYNGYPEDDIGLKRKYDKFLQLKTTEEKNRYKGVSEMKNKKWRAYTSGAKGIKPKHLGIFFKKEDALKCIENFYSNHTKTFLT